MSTRRWLSGAAAVAQVDTLTVGGTVEASDIFIVTLTAEDGTTQAISTVAGSTNTTTVATTIKTALAASTLPLFAAITWTTATVYVIGTAKVAGVPFYCAATTTETGGGAADDQTFSRAATTANAGPNDWNTALNWSAATVPVNADDVYVDEGTSAADILYGLNQSGVTLDEFRISQLYTGKIGTATAYLQIGAATAAIGEYFGTDSPQGSGRIKIDFGSSNVDVTVTDSGITGTETNQKPIRLKINHASATLAVLRGNVGLCVGTAETGQVTTLIVGFVTNLEQDADVEVGPGVTIGTITKYGGKLLTQSGATTLTQNGGQVQTEGTAAFTTMIVNAGNAILNASGTIAHLDSNGGLADFTRSPVARTVSDWDVAAGASIAYDSAVVTVTAGPTFTGAMRMNTTKIYG
jgi:hypothetical protein